MNLTSPSPLPSTCTDTAHGVAASAFANKPFTIDRYLRPGDKTCPAEGVFAAGGVLKDSAGALPGGCTEDIVHRFYQEQYQLDGGKQDRYTVGSDAAGLTQGVYATKALPIYRYLHGDLHSVVDANGMPRNSYPLYRTTATVKDAQLTQACDKATTNADVACGDYAVNTIQPTGTPHAASGAQLPLIDDAEYPNIGDRLSAKGISWNWFSGGWDDAEAGNPGRSGVSDQFGPGTRIPALLVSARFSESGVDHTVYDTTSILATIEHAFRLEPVATRDAKVADLRRVDSPALGVSLGL